MKKSITKATTAILTASLCLSLSFTSCQQLNDYDDSDYPKTEVLLNEKKTESKITTDSVIDGASKILDLIEKTPLGNDTDENALWKNSAVNNAVVFLANGWKQVNTLLKKIPFGDEILGKIPGAKILDKVFGFLVPGAESDSKELKLLKSIDSKLDSVKDSLEDLKTGIAEANSKLNWLEDAEFKKIVDRRLNTLQHFAIPLKAAIIDIEEIENDRTGKYQNAEVRNNRYNQIVKKFCEYTVDGNTVFQLYNQLLQDINNSNNVANMNYYEVVKAYYTGKYYKDEAAAKTSEILTYESGIIYQAFPIMIVYTKNMYCDSTNPMSIGSLTTLAENYEAYGRYIMEHPIVFDEMKQTPFYTYMNIDGKSYKFKKAKCDLLADQEYELMCQAARKYITPVCNDIFSAVITHFYVNDNNDGIKAGPATYGIHTTDSIAPFFVYSSMHKYVADKLIPITAYKKLLDENPGKTLGAILKHYGFEIPEEKEYSRSYLFTSDTVIELDHKQREKYWSDEKEPFPGVTFKNCIRLDSTNTTVVYKTEGGKKVLSNSNSKCELKGSENTRQGYIFEKDKEIRVQYLNLVEVK